MSGKVVFEGFGNVPVQAQKTDLDVIYILCAAILLGLYAMMIGCNYSCDKSDLASDARPLLPSRISRINE